MTVCRAITSCRPPRCSAYRSAPEEIGDMILLGNPYTIKNGIVHWGRHPVPQADPATFQHLGGDWGWDARHVFVQAKAKKIDVATFEYLNPVFVKDANNAYDW